MKYGQRALRNIEEVIGRTLEQVLTILRSAKCRSMVSNIHRMFNAKKHWLKRSPKLTNYAVNFYV